MTKISFLLPKSNILFLYIDPESGSIKNSRSLQATLGLVVHAAGKKNFPFFLIFLDCRHKTVSTSAADGIALGAAATTSHAATEMIVFLAIMLHKVIVCSVAIL